MTRDLVLDGYVSPPLNFEYFLTGVYEATAAKGGQRPRTFDAAFLTTRYRSEFAMSDIPAPVQRVLFPVVAALGRLMGLGRRFAGAPDPVVPLARSPCAGRGTVWAWTSSLRSRRSAPRSTTPCPGRRATR